MSNAQASSVVMTFDVDADEVWIGEDPHASSHPVTLSQGLYEVRLGLRLVLETLEQFSAVGTFFVPGRVAERHPSTVESILEGGHEVAHHGYTHRAPATLDPESEQEEFARSIEALRVFGVEPLGYRAPSWALSEHTLQFAAEAGFAYSSNFMDDVRPYTHENGIRELPVHWNLDDAAHFWFAGDDSWTRKIATNDEANAVFDAELDGIRSVDGVCVYTFHPQIVGRPGRLPVLRHALERVLSESSSRLLTASQALGLRSSPTTKEAHERDR